MGISTSLLLFGAQGAHGLHISRVHTEGLTRKGSMNGLSKHGREVANARMQQALSAAAVDQLGTDKDAEAAAAELKYHIGAELKTYIDPKKEITDLEGPLRLLQNREVADYILKLAAKQTAELPYLQADPANLHVAVCEPEDAPKFESDKKGLNICQGDDTPVHIFGDTHGRFMETVRMVRSLDLVNTKKDQKVIFNGDFVDRGPMGQNAPNLLFLLWLRTAFPTQVLLLRGNHEDRRLNTASQAAVDNADPKHSEKLRRLHDNVKPTLWDDVHEFYLEDGVNPTDAWLNVHDNVLDKLPFSATVHGRVVVAHAGFSRAFLRKVPVENIEVIGKYLEDEVDWSGSKLAAPKLLFKELAFADPDQRDSEFESPRGDDRLVFVNKRLYGGKGTPRGPTYDSKTLADYLGTHNSQQDPEANANEQNVHESVKVQLFVRGHEPTSEDAAHFRVGFLDGEGAGKMIFCLSAPGYAGKGEPGTFLTMRTLPEVTPEKRRHRLFMDVLGKSSSPKDWHAKVHVQAYLDFLEKHNKDLDVEVSVNVVFPQSSQNNDRPFALNFEEVQDWGEIERRGYKFTGEGDGSSSSEPSGPQSEAPPPFRDGTDRRLAAKKGRLGGA